MPTWLIIILIVAVVGAVIGFLENEKGERAEGAVQCAIGSAMGCRYLLLQLFLWGFGIMVLIWIFGVIFG